MSLPPYQASIADLVEADRGFRGRMLDVGCGGWIPSCLATAVARADQLDGVDPGPAVLTHPGLTRRWQGEFESSAVPAGAYDAAYAYNVVEHVRDPEGFLHKLAEVLKPGGVFWAVTPNARHPFCLTVRVVERLGLKRAFGAHHPGINDYPAYYRLNTEGSVRRMAAAAGFTAAAFHYFHVPGWENGYCPRGTRWIARLHDATIAACLPSRRLVVAYRLQRGS